MTSKRQIQDHNRHSHAPKRQGSDNPSRPRAKRKKTDDLAATGQGLYKTTPSSRDRGDVDDDIPLAQTQHDHIDENNNGSQNNNVNDDDAPNEFMQDYAQDTSQDNDYSPDSSDTEDNEVLQDRPQITTPMYQGTPTQRAHESSQYTSVVDTDIPTGTPRTITVPKQPPSFSQDFTDISESHSTSICLGTPLTSTQQATLKDNALEGTLPATTPTNDFLDDRGIPSFARNFVLWERTQQGWGIHNCVAQVLRLQSSTAHRLSQTEVGIQVKIAAFCQQLPVRQRQELADIFGAITDHVRGPTSKPVTASGTARRLLLDTPPPLTQPQRPHSDPPRPTYKQSLLATPLNSRMEKTNNHSANGGNTMGTDRLLNLGLPTTAQHVRTR